MTATRALSAGDPIYLVTRLIGPHEWRADVATVYLSAASAWGYVRGHLAANPADRGSVDVARDEYAAEVYADAVVIE